MSSGSSLCSWHGIFPVEMLQGECGEENIATGQLSLSPTLICLKLTFLEADGSGAIAGCLILVNMGMGWGEPTLCFTLGPTLLSMGHPTNQ